MALDVKLHLQRKLVRNEGYIIFFYSNKQENMMNLTDLYERSLSSDRDKGDSMVVAENRLKESVLHR